MHAMRARARSGPRVAARHGKMITPPTLQQIYTDYYSCSSMCSSYGLRVRRTIETLPGVHGTAVCVYTHMY